MICCRVEFTIEAAHDSDRTWFCCECLKTLKIIGNVEWSISCRNMQLELILFFPLSSTKKFEEKKNL